MLSSPSNRPALNLTIQSVLPIVPLGISVCMTISYSRRLSSYIALRSSIRACRWGEGVLGAGSLASSSDMGFPVAVLILFLLAFRVREIAAFPLPSRVRLASRVLLTHCTYTSRIGRLQIRARAMNAGACNENRTLPEAEASEVRRCVVESALTRPQWFLSLMRFCRMSGRLTREASQSEGLVYGSGLAPPHGLHPSE